MPFPKAKGGVGLEQAERGGREWESPGDINQ